MKAQLRKFCIRHFNYDATDMQILDDHLFDLIISEYDIDGMSEYELVDIIDEELFKVTNK